MFSRHNRRLAAIDVQRTQLFDIVRGQGPQGMRACRRGVFSALLRAREKAADGWRDRGIAIDLADRGTPMAGKSCCEGLGFGLVSFMYECRAMGSRKAERLAARIHGDITTIHINAIHHREWPE